MLPSSTDRLYRVDVKGKRVAVVGTGSTGVQIAQETGKEADHVTVFQRTPNLCLPMRQRKLTKEEQDEAKKDYPDLYKYRMTTFAGFGFDFAEKNTFDDNNEEREKFYQKLWDDGKQTCITSHDCGASRHNLLITCRWFRILAGNI